MKKETKQQRYYWKHKKEISERHKLRSAKNKKVYDKAKEAFKRKNKVEIFGYAEELLSQLD